MRGCLNTCVYVRQSCDEKLSDSSLLYFHLQDDTIFSWYSGEGAARVADRWGGRVRRVLDGRLGLGRGSINVSAVRETDAGLYRCRVTFPNRTPPARNNGTFYYLEVDGEAPLTLHSTFLALPTSPRPHVFYNLSCILSDTLLTFQEVI